MAFVQVIRTLFLLRGRFHCERLREILLNEKLSPHGILASDQEMDAWSKVLVRLKITEANSSTALKEFEQVRSPGNSDSCTEALSVYDLPIEKLSGS